MDKGAHYHKCDFQVHSPRDINWTGKKFGVNSDQASNLTEEEKTELQAERVQFAKEYIEKARDKGISALAITDHHDVVFVKVIRSVAREENRQLIDAGTPEKCITVFPGIELTLVSPNCQALILFDADFPDAHLDSVIALLGLSPSHEFDRATAATTRIPQEHISNLVALHHRLDETPYCRGRYIVLPNLNYGGNSTLLRAGAHDHYVKMPCVGGYVDKEMPTETGWLNKTNGGDVNYGNKAVGIVSTSDNRFEDGREFGKYFTWVKWAEPSAEALRQACLARQSRISQDTPNLPQICITKLDVTNSKFLGSFSIEFNQQYNVLIGGRGTGKSTILEYLRWGLCDQIVSSSDPDEMTELERRRRKLVENTLTSFEGEVRITFMLNGINHIIKRSSVTKEIFLKIDNGEFQQVTEEEVRKILPIQAYSQKQLSSVGVSTEELRRFIQLPISNSLDALDYTLNENIQRAGDKYRSLLRKRELESETEQFTLETSSITTQVAGLRAGLTGMSAEDQTTMAKKASFDSEGNIVETFRRELNTAFTKISELETALQIFPEPLPENTQLENAELIGNLNTAVDTKFQQIKGQIEQLKAAFTTENTAAINGLIDQWRNIKTQFDVQYAAAISRSTSNQQQLTEIARLETRLRQIQTNITERQTKLRELGDPNSEFDTLRMEYWTIARQKAALLKEQANKFTELSKNLIRVDVEKKLDVEIIRSELSRVLTGTRINNEKLQAVCDIIKRDDNPLLVWETILNELRQLSELGILGNTTGQLPACPKLVEAGFTDTNQQRVVEVLTTENWLSLATMKLEFAPHFRYATNTEMEDLIPFSDASAGQQATALLTVLLNQPGTPLLIDQPEDDIDNRAIDDIIKNIWESKKHRQLIFTSHNANLVVNGDAELVICCDYRDSGSQTRGVLKAQGAIDSQSVKSEITSVMEGGEKAFKLRMEKYGF